MSTAALNLQERLLPGVSRTFALTIPQLPTGLRPAITNAYLLCRIADTVEDSAHLDPNQKDRHYAALVDLLHERADPARFTRTLLAESRVEDPLERELVLETPAVLDVFRELPPEQREPLRRCVTIMCRGMARFERLKHPEGLPDAAAFRDYCYVVAGVVGEMLTSLFASNNPDIAERRHRLHPLAVAFGQGLQMTNILKDVWEDRRRGICWLPRDVLRTHGFTPRQGEDWSRDHRYREALGFLVGVAHRHLRLARDYTLQIPASETGIRRFCSWAIGMALYTLRNIADNRGYTAGDQVKISHARLRTIITTCNLSAGSNRLLDMAFRLGSRGLPLVDEQDVGQLAAEGRPTCTD